MKLPLGFLAEVLRFEKKKLLLPALAVLAVFCTSVLLTQFRAMDLDREIARSSTEEMTELTVNSTLNREFGAERPVQADAPAHQGFTDAERLIYQGTLQGLALLRSPVFPVGPSGFLGEVLESGGKPTLFPRSEGYVLSEEFVESFLVTAYRRQRFEELERAVEDGDVSRQEYLERVDRLRDRGVGSEQVRRFVSDPAENQMLSPLSEQTRQKAVSGELVELQPWHFAPAALMSSVWLYLLTGLSVAAVRRIREMREK
jgi:hypothetical protein